MEIMTAVSIVLSYLIGSIPFGLLVVRLFTGKDVRNVGSGRTGGTNVYRASGTGAGIITAILDGLKGLSCGLLAAAIVPGNELVKVICAGMAIVGHNYSIFLVYRNGDNKVRFHGGAGGATCFGGAISLWWPIGIILIPVTLLAFFVLGYASLTTISIALTALVVFLLRWLTGVAGWQDILYGLVALVLVILALRPNLKRLLAGTERQVGLRAWIKNRKTRDEGSEPKK